MSNARPFARLSAFAAASLLATALPAMAGESFTAKVKDASDGDTLVIGSGGRVRVVQLAGIDAPELTQEFGVAARDLVKQLTAGRRVTVEVLESNGRLSLVGRVLVDGKDLAESLVAAGMAWSEESSSPDLRSAQQKAKSSGQGLWASANPTPPWEYRKSA